MTEQSTPTSPPVQPDRLEGVVPDDVHDHVQRLDHVAIATWSIESVLPLYREVIGGTFVLGGDDVERGVRTLQLQVPGTAKIELMMPTRASSTLVPFLKARGPGMHHLTLLVDDVTDVLAKLQGRGYECTETNLSCSRWRETFVRPASSGGVLIQFADSTEDWMTPLTNVTIEDVLAGRVSWVDYLPVTRPTEEVETP